MPTPEPSLYGWITIGGILIGAWLWQRRIRHAGPERFGIFVGSLVGAFLGAKIVYLLAEGWLHWGAPDFWFQAAVGKTILGGLLGGYAGVEFTKQLVNAPEPTGDWFAIIVPAGIAMGRVGCLRQGCCLGETCDPTAWYAWLDRTGVARWPAVPVELAFNLLALVVLWRIRRRGACQGQLFHSYLMAYGLFRFAHEFARGTPKVIGGALSGYHVAAFAVFGLGLWGYLRRRHAVRPQIVD
jgi:phosphatidylglycerol:prolipoprotein diacylglycerol transferase